MKRRHPTACGPRRRAAGCVLAAALLGCSGPPPVDRAARVAEAAARHPVTILRDTWGVPHVFGRSDADAAFGLAYAHAEDDFGQLQRSVLMARGELAAHAGPGAAPLDYAVQLLRVWQTVDERWERDLSPATRALLAGYAAGLEHYAALHPGEVLPGVLPFRAEDVAAGFLLMTPMFVGFDRVLADLTGEASPPLRPGESPIGSNTFAVAPSRSADGATRLAVNSHQPWEGPVAWYEAHLHSDEGLDIVGGVFPIAPLVLHGHNRELGWAFTVNRPDVVDVYRLVIHPEDPYRYRLDGEWRSLERDAARIRVKLLGPLHWTFERELLWAEHGPALRTPHGTFAIRFSGVGQLSALEQWYRMNRARSLREWKDAMALLGIPSFNVGYADREGNIFYAYNARMPRRVPGHDWRGILPGDRSELIWREILPFERLPQVENPASGFVVNTNSSPFHATLAPDNPDPEGFPDWMGIETQLNNRALRALALFGGDPSITRDEFERYKYDMAYAPDSDEAAWLRRAQEAPTDDAALRTAQAHLRDWNRSTHPESRGAALGVLTLRPLVHHRLGWRRDLPEPIDALATANAVLLGGHGRLEVPWREVNRLRRGSVDLGLGGGPDVLHAVYGGEPVRGRSAAHAGDSYVLLVEWDRDGRVSSRSVHQFGAATSRPDSPHYADQAPLFAARRLKPVWLDEAEIRRNLEREYRPGEEPAAR